jgi:hypothetical protein
VYSADNVLINYIRSPIVQMDPRSIGVTAQAAHDLGLGDGQVVQATVEVRDNRVSLVIKGFLIDAPTFKTDAPKFNSGAPTFKIDVPNWSAGDLKSGDTVQLKASLTTNGWALTPNLGPGTSIASPSTYVGGAGTGGTLGAVGTGVTSSPNSLSNNNAVVHPSNNTPLNTAPSPALSTLNNSQDTPETQNPQSINALNANAPSANTVRTGLNPSLNSTQAMGTNVVPNWSNRLNALMFEPAELSVVFELLMPGAIASLLPQPQLQSWVQRWNANRLSMASLNPTALKNIVLAQSSSVERQLLGSMTGSNRNSNNSNPSISDSSAAVAALNEGGENSGIEQDPKTMLRTLSALLERMQPTPETTKLSHQLKAATNELESAQVQTAQQLMRGELAFHAVIPFWDADPVDLYFKKSKSGKEDDAEHQLSVDIHSKSRVLGEIWLNTSIKQSTQVDLVMWAVRPEVAELARTNASELGYELGVSGLTLNSFQIFNATKPSEEQVPRPHAGSVLDTRV